MFIGVKKSNILSRMKQESKKLSVFTLSMMLSLVASAMVFAADDFDMTSAITTSVGDIKTQIFGIIAVIVPVVLAIVGAKLGISKGISIFKSMTNKGA